VLRALCSRRASVVAPSKAVAEDCARVLPRARVSLIENAIDTAYFSPGPGDSAWLAGLSGMDAPAAGTTTFALVATYARWKGQDLLLRAAAQALYLDRGMKARWYIVGAPIYQTSGDQFSRDELSRLAHELGIEKVVGFVPFVSDVARVFRAADVVVHASSGREAFGRSIVEGMACGRPVIACAAGGAAELFEDGVTALGFSPGDEAGLAKAMLRVWREPALAERLAFAGRQHALERYDRSRLGPELLSVYQDVLGTGGS
jgi:glycosyltransferase involved in cell wall biosynthesis